MPKNDDGYKKLFKHLAGGKRNRQKPCTAAARRAGDDSLERVVRAAWSNYRKAKYEADKLRFQLQCAEESEAKHLRDFTILFNASLEESSPNVSAEPPREAGFAPASGCPAGEVSKGNQDEA